MAKLNMTITGVDRTIKRKLKDGSATEDIDKIIGDSMKRISTNAARRAPVDTGLLRRTLKDGAKRAKPMRWELISGTNYTTYQEYNNSRGKTGFMRTSLYEEVEVLRKELESWAKQKKGL